MVELILFLKTLVAVFCALFGILVVILADRKILAAVQGREGPSIVGVFGALQTAMDGMKVFFKTHLFSRTSSKFVFFVTPVLVFCVGLLNWLFIPTMPNSGSVDFIYDLLAVYFLMGLDVLLLIFAAWSAFSSKFPSLGAIREIVQMCAYELITGFCFLAVALHSGSLSIRTAVQCQEQVWFGFVVTPYMLFFFVVVLAELHRTPFDLAESESELTAGYQTEHGGSSFSMFFLGEYNGWLVFSALTSLLFLGGWYLPFGFVSILLGCIKMALVVFVCIVIRAVLPRTRVAAMLKAGWSFLLPYASNLISIYIASAFISKAMFPSEYFYWGTAFLGTVLSLYFLSMCPLPRKVGGNTPEIIINQAIMSMDSGTKVVGVDYLKNNPRLRARNAKAFISDQIGHGFYRQKSRYPVDAEINSFRSGFPLVLGSADDILRTFYADGARTLIPISVGNGVSPTALGLRASLSHANLPRGSFGKTLEDSVAVLREEFFTKFLLNRLTVDHFAKPSSLDTILETISRYTTRVQHRHDPYSLLQVKVRGFTFEDQRTGMTDANSFLTWLGEAPTGKRKKSSWTDEYVARNLLTSAVGGEVQATKTRPTVDEFGYSTFKSKYPLKSGMQVLSGESTADELRYAIRRLDCILRGNRGIERGSLAEWNRAQKARRVMTKNILNMTVMSKDMEAPALLPYYWFSKIYDMTISTYKGGKFVGYTMPFSVKYCRPFSPLLTVEDLTAIDGDSWGTDLPFYISSA